MEKGDSPGGGSRMAPQVGWKSFTDAPLAGLALARETMNLLAWDESRQVYLFDSEGQRIQTVRAPAPILAARISDTGTLCVLLTGGPRLLFLDAKLGLTADRPGPSGAINLDVDPHGRYVVVLTRQAESHFFNRLGKPAGKFSTRQPLSHIRFVPASPHLIGAAGYGVLMGLSLHPGPSPGTLKAEPEWEERLLSNLGRLEVSGDAAMVLASCYNLGIQRYNADGQNEGSYHLGGTAIHAVPDFPGRSIAVATQEGNLAILNRTGNVRWKTDLDTPPVGLVIDALGRFLVHGAASGEITRLDLEPQSTPRPAAAPRPAPPRAPSNLRAASWSTPIGKSAEDAEVAVLALLSEPQRVGVLTKGNQFRVLDAKGQPIGEPPGLRGIGRILRTAPGWIAAATDRQVVIHECATGAFHKPQLDLVEVTHLAIRPESYGMVIVQERDRIGRATLAGRWVWKKELRRPIEDVAIGPHGLTAYTSENGQLHVLDAAGEQSHRAPFESEEPLLLVETPSAHANVTYISLARHTQVLRGHSAEGQVLWESPTPWEAWQLQNVGNRTVISAPDGRVAAYSQDGHLLEQGGSEALTHVLFPGPGGQVVRLIKRDRQLICTTLGGQTLWRALVDEDLGPMVGSSWGVCACVGSKLTFFPQG